ncbi:hypothetical protein TNCV_4623561 [Trichonephila clavipes]|nr:hypothetical protein TNCV_4623561 [Trichonephila clavipes]
MVAGLESGFQCSSRSNDVTKMLGSSCKIRFWVPSRILQRIAKPQHYLGFGPPRILSPTTMRDGTLRHSPEVFQRRASWEKWQPGKHVYILHRTLVKADNVLLGSILLVKSNREPPP